jgi:hypothetical protein
MVSRYGPKAQEKVARVMRERKRGTLKSGGSGKRVTSRKQAIAIGLAEARREGARVPRKPARRRGKTAKTTKTAMTRRATTARKSNTRKKQNAARRRSARR